MCWRKTTRANVAARPSTMHCSEVLLLDVHLVSILVVVEMSATRSFVDVLSLCRPPDNFCPHKFFHIHLLSAATQEVMSSTRAFVHWLAVFGLAHNGIASRCCRCSLSPRGCFWCSGFLCRRLLGTFLLRRRGAHLFLVPCCWLARLLRRSLSLRC